MTQSPEFVLDEDELDHMQAISTELIERLSLTNTGAIISVNGLYAVQDKPDISEPKGVVALLLAKAAQNVRFSVNGLTLGYYPGAVAAIRSSMEALEYSSLFLAKPESAFEWLQIQVLRNKSTGRPDQEVIDREEALKREAKKVLNEGEQNQKTFRNLRRIIKDEANLHVHVSLDGLASQFGVDPQAFLPPELDNLLAGGEDLEMALALNAFMAKNNAVLERQSQDDDRGPAEGVSIELFSRYDQDTLDIFSLFALHVVHLTLDLVESAFDIPGDDPFVQAFKDWHREIDRL